MWSLCWFRKQMLFHVVPFNSLAATGLAAHPIFAGPQLEMSSFKDHWYLVRPVPVESD